MNILEIVSGAQVNGAVIHALSLSKELQTRGHNVWMLCRPDAWIGEQSVLAGVPVIESTLERRKENELQRIAQFCQQEAIQIIHTHMTRAHNFGARLRKRCDAACVSTAHTHTLNFHWRQVDHVIAVSHATMRFHQRFNRVPTRRISVIHGFVKDELLNSMATASKRASLRSALGVASDNYLIGCFGDVIPRKGQRLLVNALPGVLKEATRARLLIAGYNSSRYAQSAMRACEQLGIQERVMWLGLRKDVPDLLLAIDLYALPSRSEMLPVSVLEAMAAGVPVIASAVGGVPEAVRQGETGWLIPPNNSARLADAILYAYRHPEEAARIKQYAQRAVREEFSLSRQAAKTEQLFQQIIATKQPMTITPHPP